MVNNVFPPAQFCRCIVTSKLGNTELSNMTFLHGKLYYIYLGNDRIDILKTFLFYFTTDFYNIF